jgi:hypothetical protein
MTLKTKCNKCRVAKRVGGYLFGCNKRERLARELDLLIQEADSRIDPVVEQLKQCPEAFTAGKAIEQLFHSRDSQAGDAREGSLPRSGAVMCPFV